MAAASPRSRSKAKDLWVGELIKNSYRLKKLIKIFFV
jgi:hypothetical protein